MTAIFSRFPHIGDAIVQRLGFEELASYRGMNRTWMEFIDSQRFYQDHIQRVINEKAGRFYRENGIYNRDEKTPLHAAAIAGQIQVFENRWDAEIRFQNEFFHSEATPYNVDMIQAIQGINTPFHFAAQLGNWSICFLIGSALNLRHPFLCREDGKLLVSMDLNPRNGCGNTPLHKAAINNGIELFNLIMPNIDIKNPKNSAGWTPLHLAAKHGHFEICEIIASWIAPEEVAVQCQNLWTPLHHAAENGHSEICQFIIGIVQSRDPRLRHGETPRYLAKINLARIERETPRDLARIQRYRDTVAVFE